MAAYPSLGEQVRGLVSAVRHYDENRVTSEPRDKQSPLITLVWPLIPLLPPHPPTLVSDLLAERQEALSEKCDVCGGSALPLYTTSAGVKLRQPQTPLDKRMADIEQQMHDTLADIESRTKQTVQLNKQTKELELSGKSQLSDSEMLKTLKALIKDKSEKEDKVKILEQKEQQLTESLITAINWAKNIGQSYEMDQDVVEDIKRIGKSYVAGQQGVVEDIKSIDQSYVMEEQDVVEDINPDMAE